MTCAEATGVPSVGEKELAEQLVETGTAFEWNTLYYICSIACLFLGYVFASVRFLLGTKWKLERDQALLEGELKCERIEREKCRDARIEDSSIQWDHINKINDSLGLTREALARIEGLLVAKSKGQ